LRFEFFISRRYLKAKRKKAFLSLITLLSTAGVAVGVTALIIVIAVMAGVKSELESKILGVESHLVLMRYSGEFTNYTDDIKRIGNMKNVLSASPFVYSQVMLKSRTSTAGAILKGINFTSEAGAIGERLRNISPEEKKKTKIPQIILGRRLAEKLNVNKKDILYLILTKGRISPIGHIPVMKRAIVAGIFDSGMYEYDTSLVYMPIADAQHILNIGDSITGIAINVENIYEAAEIAQKMVVELGHPYWARDWMSMNKNLFSALKMEKTAMFIILILIVLVAAFNIASSLIMMVMEKKKDIAVLKAMGASDESIKKIFVLKGLIIGGLGTLIGVCSGIILSLFLGRYKFIELPEDIYFFATLPVELQAADVLIIAAASVGICLIATLYPASQAAKLNPTDAIRYG